LHRAAGATARLRSVSPVPVEDHSPVGPGEAISVAAEAAPSLAAVATSAADRILPAAAALATADKSRRIGPRLVTGPASAAAPTLAGAGQAPRLSHPTDLTSAEVASVTDLPLAIGRASAAAQTLATGARALLPTGQASVIDRELATGRASAATGLAWGSPELAAARGRTWVHSARGPQGQRSVAASLAVLASDRALCPAWETIGRGPASRLKTEGAH
jgi:hypothetical protein